MALPSDLSRSTPLAQSRKRFGWWERIGKLHFAPRHSVSLRLQWSHLATSLLPMLLLGSTLLLWSAQAERRLVERTQQTVAEWVARDIGGEILSRESELLRFARQLPLDDDGALTSEAHTFIATVSPPPRDFAILDANGQQLVRITDERTYFRHELVNEREAPFFARPSQGLTYRGSSRNENGQTSLLLAVPARNGVGQVTGVVVVYLEPRSIEAILQSVPASTGRSAFVVDERGVPLFGQPAALADSAEWPLQPDDGSAIVKRGNEKTLASHATLQSGDWRVVIEQPTSVALHDQRTSTLFVALVLVFTGVSVVHWALLLARRMTRPIRELRDASQLLASGHLGRTIPVTAEDELGELATEFNRMSLRLAESQKALEERNIHLRRGLTLARHIQRDLLPTDGLATPFVRSYALSEPASEVGGDFYTYLSRPDGCTTIVIGDASGKGVAAALVMALTTSLVEAQAPVGEGPGELLQRLNRQLYSRLNASHSSVSLLVTQFDPQARQLRAANAGMIAPLLLAADKCTYVPCYGPPLGVVPAVSFAEQTIDVDPGQIIVFVSDGIVEARNRVGELWGFERLEQTLCTVSSCEPRAVVEHVRGELAQFACDVEAADDMTVIALQFVGAEH